MILRNPSWRSLYPGIPAYIPIDTDEAEQLRNLLNASGKVFRVNFDGNPSDFHMIEETNGQKYFVKYLNVIAYEKAETIAQWLQASGLNVNAASIIKANYYVYPLLEGMRLPSTVEVLKQLGSNLAKLHHMLQQYPDCKSIESNTYKRITLLNEIRIDIAQGRLTVGPFPAFVKKLAQNKDLDFCNGNVCQVLHGDLNPGNMLLVDNKIYFFDFEDTLHSYLPLIFELAFILERLVLIQHNKSADIFSIGRAFMRSYLDNGGKYIFQARDKYALLTLALRAFCTLTLCEIEGNKINRNEWNKFVDLAKAADESQDILRKILE